jgi:hypothetical protein
MVWNLLIEHHRLPEKGKLKHLLWTLYFFKVYPKTGPGCACVGGPSGAIDPKTFLQVGLEVHRCNLRTSC